MTDNQQKADDPETQKLVDRIYADRKPDPWWDSGYEDPEDDSENTPLDHVIAAVCVLALLYVSLHLHVLHWIPLRVIWK